MTQTTIRSDVAKGAPPAQRVLVSADSHGGVPAADLRERLPKALREQHAELPTVALDLKNGTKKEPEMVPEARLSELKLDGVEAEVIYGSHTPGHKGEDLGLLVAEVQAYNDFLADVYGAHFARFAPAAVLPIPWDPYGGANAIKPTAEHIAAAAAEITRVAGLGLRPAMLPDHCDLLPYNLPDWEPVWNAAGDSGTVLAFHTGAGRNPVRVHGPGGAITNYTLVTTEMAETLSHLAAGAVLERHPDLRVTLVECGGGWLAFVMQMMDEAFVKHAHWVKPKLREAPSTYVKRQVRVTFQEDPVGIALRGFTGSQCLMWGSDYPHHEGTWPNSREAVEKQFTGVPEPDVDRIVRANAVEWFGFDLSR